MEATIGGQRLGSGNKNKVHLRDYERSTHDLSYIWRSTMACGTLVPFMSELALPGDTFDIELNCDMLTHPTIGPLFGSYKIQLDVFQCPIRLYQGKLHMNMLGIGMEMNTIKLPEIELEADEVDHTKQIDNQQINPSCLLSYFGIRGLGYKKNGVAGTIVKRNFNGVPLLAYWDIYKNYYANKQEEKGFVIHQELTTTPIVITTATILKGTPTPYTLTKDPIPPLTYKTIVFGKDTYIQIIATGVSKSFNPKNLLFSIKRANGDGTATGSELFKNWDIDTTNGVIIGTLPNLPMTLDMAGIKYINNIDEVNTDQEPQLKEFPLTNIDEMRQDILSAVKLTIPFGINAQSREPYGLLFQKVANGAKNVYNKQQNQEGLAIKTYQSDLFNNWISTEWIDGTDGISQITAIDTSDGNFTIDELNLSKKVYDMLNRIALSGGSYDDWLDAVYTHERKKSIENPMYLGGLIKNLVFQEVISNSQAEGQPLGTLAGRGVIGNKHKGGKIIAKIDEPCYLIGIISLTPHIDYSQGNKWDMNLKTMDDFHKPALDQIGFQDLITDQMAWFDTECTDVAGAVRYFSAGKQPAWINYMTNVNVVRGNFADQNQQMFMVLNRRYEKGGSATNTWINDVTTYIDPSKFNHIFADTRRDAQNFWAQIGLNITARRKMSAKVIPNL